MKITAIETFKFWVDWCNWLLVRITTDEGLCGWGEASLHGAVESVETRIRRGRNSTGTGFTTAGAGAAARFS